MKNTFNSVLFVAILTSNIIANESENFGGLGISILGGENGAVVVGVMSNSPAEEIGLQAGDLILSVNGTELSSILPQDQISYLRGDIGSSVNLMVERKGKKISFSTKRVGLSVQNLETGDISAWYGKSEGFTAKEVNHFASQNTATGYEFLSVVQYGVPISISAESLNTNAMQQISIKKVVADTDNYNSLQLAKETVLETSKDFSLVNAKGASIKAHSGNEKKLVIPAYRVK